MTWPRSSNNSTATLPPEPKIEIGFPETYEGSQLIEPIGGQSKLNGLHHMMETPALVRKIFWAEQNGYDAVISSATPSIPASMADGWRCNIPVIGPAAHEHARRLPRWPIASASPCRCRPMCPTLGGSSGTYGLDRFVTDIQPIGVYGTDVPARRRKSSKHDEADPRLVHTRTEIILPLGGALIPYVVDPTISAKATGVQVLNTKASASASPRCAFLWNDAKRYHLSARQTHIRGFHQPHVTIIPPRARTIIRPRRP